MDLPSLARVNTEALTRSVISSRSHCAIAAITVKNNRPAGVEVSIASASDIRSELCCLNISDISRSSLVFLASLASFEKIIPEIAPD